MIIKRDKYLEDLKIRMHNGMVKIITGMRRSGKSFLLNNIFYNYLLSINISEDHIIRFAFDSADDLNLIGEDLIDLEKKQRKVDPKKFMVYIKEKLVEGKYYLLLDEIQNLGSFESVLNSYLRKDNIDIYVTGSNSKFLSSDVLTEFEGRGDEIHVFPLSFREFFSAYNGTKEEAYENYSIYGGLPLLLSMPLDEQKTKYLENQLKNTYLKDIISRYNLKNDININELLDILSSSISSLINPSKLESTFKSIKKNNSISRMTINNYINYFIDAFLLSKAIRYDVKGKKYIDTPFKLYFEDIGIRNAKIGFRQIEPTHIMENIIYNELRYRGFNVDVGVVESKEKSNGKETRKYYEVDFIANTGSKKYYIQSAYDIPSEAKWKQESTSFNKIKDSFKKIIIVKNPVVSRYDNNGILILSLLDFLLDDKSLDK